MVSGGGERCVSLFCGVVGYCHGLFLLFQLCCARWGEVLRCIRCWGWEDGYLRGLETDDQRRMWRGGGEGLWE